MQKTGAQKYLPALAQTLAKHGTGGDDQIAHVTTGERLIPGSVQKNNPKLMAMLDQAFAELGMDPAAYRVGEPEGNDNQHTGAEAFYDDGSGDENGGTSGGQGDQSEGNAGGQSDASSSADGNGDVGGADGSDPDGRDASAAAQANADPIGRGLNEIAGFGPTHGYNGIGVTDVGPDGVFGPEGLVSSPQSITNISQFDKNIASVLGGVTGRAAMAAAESALSSGGTVTEAGVSESDRGNDGPSSEPKDEVAPSDEGKPEDPVEGVDTEDPLTISVTRSNLIPGDLYTPRSNGSRTSFNSALNHLNSRSQTNPRTGLPMFADKSGFDPDRYLKENPDVAENWEGDPYEHYTAFGKAEGRAGSAEEASFDADYYLKKNTDVAQNWEGSAYDHYKTFGESEGRGKSASDATAFDAGYYLQNNPDVATGWDGNPLDHYKTHGVNEGRASNQIQQARKKEGFAGSLADDDSYGLYAAEYFDHDYDPSTPWIARNDSNLNRAGQDASYMHDLYRRAGYDRSWGGGQDEAYLTKAMAEYGLTPTGNTETDLYDLIDARSKPTRFDASRYLSGRGQPLTASAPAAAPPPVTNALDVFSRLTPQRRNRFSSSRGRVQSPSFIG